MSKKATEMDITISADGNTVGVHVQGIRGDQCLDATEFIQDMGKVVERKNTREMSLQPEKKVVNTNFVRGK